MVEALPPEAVEIQRPNSEVVDMYCNTDAKEYLQKGARDRSLLQETLNRRAGYILEVAECSQNIFNRC